MPSPLIIPLTKSQRQRASEIIAQSFYDDLLSVYIWPNPEKRLAPLIHQSLTTVRYGLIYGQNYTTNEVNALLIALRFSSKEFNLWRSFRSGLLFTPFLYGRDGFKRMLQVANYSAEMHKKIIQTPHYYVMQMAVVPEQQGQGIGSTLLTEMLANVDKTAQACFLETMQANTLGFYQRHGFQVVAEGAAAIGAPKTWFMLRSAP